MSKISVSTDEFVQNSGGSTTFKNPIAVFSEIHAAIEALGRKGHLVEVVTIYPYQHGQAFPKAEPNTGYGKIVVKPPEDIHRGCHVGKVTSEEIFFESPLNPGCLTATIIEKVNAQLRKHREHVVRSLAVLDSHLA